MSPPFRGCGQRLIAWSRCLLFLAMVLVLLPGTAIAKRSNLKPTDFVPLTTLPWKAENATLESVLDAIFREPSQNIRAAVLDEYLRLIPVAQFDRALDICIQLESRD